jgi:hypothetical protein
MTTETGVQPHHTITEAKEILRPKLMDGFICPCCNQPAKMYKRKLSSAMAFALILLYQDSKMRQAQLGGWVHLENFFKSLDCSPSIRGDAPKLRFWGFIESKGGETEDSNPNNGYYRITEAGIAFVKGETVATSHMYLYNNRPFGVPITATQINIHKALDNKFNYKELMS